MKPMRAERLHQQQLRPTPCGRPHRSAAWLDFTYTFGDRLVRVGFPEEGTLLEEYNELAYDECKRLAALIDGAVDDECLEYYEGGKWLKDICWARGEDENAKPPGFTCAEP